jgi:hypothetical protein
MNLRFGRKKTKNSFRTNYYPRFLVAEKKIYFE